MDQATVKRLEKFIETTEHDRAEYGARLLTPLSEVYEIDFGVPIGVQRFRRMTLQDRVSLKDSIDTDEHTLETGAELLAKYSADQIPHEQWLRMVRKDTEYEAKHPGEETGERGAEFVRILLNLVALSEGGGEEGMAQFFRALETRLRNRSPLPVLASDTEGSVSDGAG